MVRISSSAVRLLPLTAVLAILAIVCLNHRFPVDTDAGVFYHCDSHPTDALEYHLPAANLALHDMFPIYGLIGPADEYRLCEEPDSIPYLQILQQAPAIVFPSKPPLYSFALGCAYKLFGFRPFSVVLLNAICWVLMAMMTLIAAIMLLGKRGWVAGAIGLVALVFIERKGLGMLDAELLTRTLALATSVISIKALSTGSRLRWTFGAGAVFMLLSLCKGYFLVPMFAMLVWLVSSAIRCQAKWSIAAFFAIGGVLVIIPWMLHINTMMRNGVADRLEFSEVLQAAAPVLRLQHHDEVFDSLGNYRTDVILELMLFHQYQHARENGTVVISNQMGDYNILNVHNEYCTDGDFHPEWRIIQTSFYNTAPVADKYTRVFNFYRENMRLGLRVTAAKLKASISQRPWMLFAAVLASALLLITGRFPTALVPSLMILCMGPIVVVLFYGDPRFLQSTEAAATLLAVIGVAILVRSPLSQKCEPSLDG